MILTDKNMAERKKKRKGSPENPNVDELQDKKGYMKYSIE